MLLPSAGEYIKECSKQKEWAVNPDWNSRETAVGVLSCDKWHITAVWGLRQGEGKVAVEEDWKHDEYKADKHCFLKFCQLRHSTAMSSYPPVHCTRVKRCLHDNSFLHGSPKANKERCKFWVTFYGSANRVWHFEEWFWAWKLFSMLGQNTLFHQVESCGKFKLEGFGKYLFYGLI